ncbi:ABC transporter substrate-binding protein [Streptomyces sp. DSM 44915]|uniref:ABC transporter substrate-binding protein n=1 Tax=Streptomyces chisholmiae TaxID=3075540 RepID=A0ABU2JST2_9ACTN|nr:ABC transporter substrate-binding protein [Streptomyces sp. DSM 44915]MDT0268049.1 ABC transporter substrate-binding protein [Streptomyces sp. DSM 44915]
MTPTKRARRARAAIAGGALCALLATGCGGGSSNDGGGGGGGGGAGSDTLNIFSGASGDFQANFNPYSPTKLEGAGSIFEPLFFLNIARSEDPVPLLGTEYSWNEDGTELSITLREGVEWSDGEAFTADDVKFTFDMLRENEAINSIGFDGETTVVDDTHVTVAFESTAYMDAAELLGRTWIVPEHIWSDVDPATDTMTEPVGTGPYTLGEFKAQSFTLTANPNHWDGEPAVKTIRSLSLSGNQAGADALSAGQVDWLTSPVPSLDRVEEVYPGYTSVVANTFQIVLGTCSNEELGCEGPQTDPAVRQAIYHAMDRETIDSLAFQGIAAPMSPGFGLPDRDYISPDLENQVTEMTGDVESATAVLEAAGWERDGDGLYQRDGEELSLSVRAVSGWTDYITTLQTMTEQLRAAGIELIVEQSSWNEWSEARGRGDYELIIDALNPGPTADPYWQYINYYTSENTQPVGENTNTNWARYANPEVDAAIEELSHIDPADADARQPHLDLIQTTIEQEMPYIPVLLNGTVSIWNQDKFTGWPTEDDLYTFPALWQSPDNSLVYKNLRPAGGE